MKVAVYPGSFNPWHEGHEDILRKALEVFDLIFVARGKNTTKDTSEDVAFWESEKIFHQRNKDLLIADKKVYWETFDTLLPEYVASKRAHAVVRGLRNGHDLQYETNQQYWYEDLGLKVPVVYFITDRKLSHISGSAIRALEKFKKA